MFLKYWFKLNLKLRKAQQNESTVIFIKKWLNGDKTVRRRKCILFRR